jgi:hypothetical protein
MSAEDDALDAMAANYRKLMAELAANKGNDPEFHALVLARLKIHRGHLIHLYRLKGRPISEDLLLDERSEQ